MWRGHAAPDVRFPLPVEFRQLTLKRGHRRER
jgi:hypothetical protein